MPADTTCMTRGCWPRRSIQPGADCSHRHHKPAGDHNSLGQRTGRAHLQRHRVAVPPHSGPVPAAEAAPGTGMASTVQDTRRGLVDRSAIFPPRRSAGYLDNTPRALASGPWTRAAAALARWTPGCSGSSPAGGCSRPMYTNASPHHAVQHPHPATGTTSCWKRLCRSPGTPCRRCCACCGVMRLYRPKHPEENRDSRRRHGRRPAGRPVWPWLVFAEGRLPKTPMAPVAFC